MLTVGIKGKRTMTVEEKDTANAALSGTMNVFATPYLIALMEATALLSVEPFMEEGKTTVGTKIDISHDAPTPVGMKVTCESELQEVDGRRLVFSVEAYDEVGRIGGGTHERFIIDREKFQAKADNRGTDEQR